MVVNPRNIFGEKDGKGEEREQRKMNTQMKTGLSWGLGGAAHNAIIGTTFLQ